MANGPFTIRIFVPDGDPEGVRLIDRMNWTGHGIAFPREKWPTTKQRSEFSRTGLYILSGYKDGADDLPTIYIGEGDVIRNRIESLTFRTKIFGIGQLSSPLQTTVSTRLTSNGSNMRWSIGPHRQTVANLTMAPSLNRPR